MKTAKTWIEETLSPELAEKAIKNSTDYFLSLETSSFEDALEGIFIWDQSQEGHKFWSNVWYRKF